MDRLLVAVAARQHGVVTLLQLQDLGLGERAVHDRVSSGRLHRIHRGVYAVGRRDLPIKGHRMAAVLACGEGAVLSHRSAATLHELLNVRSGRIDVAIPRQSSLRRPGLRVHRSTCLRPEDCAIVEGIPCTSVPATLLSLAATSPRNVLESASNKAEIMGVLDLGAIRELLGRRRSHPGATRLRAALEVDGLGADRTERHLEGRFARLAREHGIPAPEVNAWIAIPGGEMQCDFAWHRERLIVEVDGWATHRTRRAFHDDRRRDRLLQAAGRYVLRFTDRDVRREPEHVTAVVGALLQRPRAPTLGAVARP
jgi:putative AbiEi antitoxin of type IV toxin-antitoxin system/uncharacterized protein DUF559